ncbi:hypothetical protein [Streptomyces sp. MZ04]|uniref:hypothetical protein n=1 Tax=Streptomyces sp. MZ04 TaxID=2559236 RepID=UPI00107EBF0F|nr:hypothetical protein [Streptomyces sp. MZ04]TGB15505.1 hypothetical protein E2651_02460 [Streptomyces sp. MZ04]
MDTTAPSPTTQQIWYLATLGHDALLQALAPLRLPTSVTYDPLSLAARVVAADPNRHSDFHRTGQAVLRPLFEATTFSVIVTDDFGPMEVTGVVPVIGEHTVDNLTGQYAELLLFDTSGPSAAFRLSKMPGDKTWIIDTDFQPSGHPRTQQPFGSSRLGRKRTVRPPLISALNRLAAQADGHAT